MFKGVAGRLLIYLLRTHLREGRPDFTNEKVVPIRLVRTGRGRIRLGLARPASLEEATAD